MNWKVERIALDDDAAFDEIEEFGTEAGLPFFPPERGNLLAQFVIRDDEGKLGAAGRLEYTYSHPFAEEIAVREDLRRSGLGSMIVKAILDEASRRDIDMIWAMARAPEFFRSLGFEPAPEVDLLAKLKEECKVCRDHITVCNPILMKRKT